MSAITDFQKKLLTDPATRKAFAENPQKVLDDLGVKLPPGTEIPKQIPEQRLEAAINEVNQGLRDQGTNLDTIDSGSTAAVTRFVENAIPLRTRDLQAMAAAHDEFASAAMRVGGGDVATVAVVGAVVAAVVAVPVAVYGFGADRYRQFIRPELGVEGVSSRAGGLVVHAPNGVRIQGMTVNQVADLITRLQARGGGGGVG
ncbi:MAG: hypothetical protein M1118_07950 [Chloroflexi bacterium]|nr:hypothetical protein [Chloroflexota bacterium]